MNYLNMLVSAVLLVLPGASSPASLPANTRWAALPIQTLPQHRQHHRRGWKALDDHTTTVSESQVDNCLVGKLITVHCVKDEGVLIQMLLGAATYWIENWQHNRLLQCQLIWNLYRHSLIFFIKWNLPSYSWKSNKTLKFTPTEVTTLTALMHPEIGKCSPPVHSHRNYKTTKQVVKLINLCRLDAVILPKTLTILDFIMALTRVIRSWGP